MYARRRLNRSIMVSLSIAAVPAGSVAQDEVTQPNLESWMDMKRRVVTARELIGSSVTNGVTPMGMIRDVLLAPDGTEVDYLLVEVPYPISLWGAGDGIVPFDEATIERTAALDLQVRFDQGESIPLPEQVEEAEAGGPIFERLASQFLGRRARFEGGDAFRIDNLLIGPQTGTVTHYVVETDPEAIIRGERRAVPTRYVEIRDDGMIHVSLSAEDLDDVQEFDPAHL